MHRPFQPVHITSKIVNLFNEVNMSTLKPAIHNLECLQLRLNSPTFHLTACWTENTIRVPASWTAPCVQLWNWKALRCKFETSVFLRIYLFSCDNDAYAILSYCLDGLWGECRPSAITGFSWLPIGRQNSPNWHAGLSIADYSDVTDSLIVYGRLYRYFMSFSL